MMSLKHDLVRPAAFPLLQPAKVELIETHLSWVFLLERDVFKVKKPVDLGFVDFRTVAQRKAACEAEILLNRRLSDGVYLGVVPIVETPAGACVGREGEPVDWAVHMRRLPDRARADLLLDAHALRGEQVDQLAEQIARFHAAARSDAETARFGSVETIRHNVFENFAQTASRIREVLSEAEAEEIEVYQSWFLREFAALFAERAASGRVRDGHGDLRLEHVYFGESGAATIIDCIEFNERFRFGDVCSDLAFLSMDLTMHDRPDLAERLLARYARASNDFDLYALVDFYESYRAFVRGKVALILAADEGAKPELRARARREARRFFLCALSAARPAVMRPFVLAVGGLVGTGKSTVAEQLSSEFGIAVVSSDRTRKHLAGVQAEQRLGSVPFAGAYAPEQTAKTYAELRRRASVVLESGRPVILDASFREASEREAVRALAIEHGVPFLFAECRCPREVSFARLRAREAKASVSDAGHSLADTFAQRFEPVDELRAAEHVVLQTEQPVERIRASLANRLGLSAPHAAAPARSA